MGLKSWFNRKKQPKAAPAAVPPEDILPSIEMEAVVIPAGIMTASMVVVPDPDPYTAGKKGSAEDIRNAYRKHFSNADKIKELKRGIIESAVATTLENGDGWIRLAAYLECVQGGVTKAQDKENHLRQMAAGPLNEILKAKLLQSGKDIGVDAQLPQKAQQAALQKHRLQALSGKGLSPESRQQTLDLALRAACADKADAAVVDLLIKAGADIHTDGERPLVNAVMEGGHKLARHLITHHKANISQAQARAEAVYSQKSPKDKFLAFCCAGAINDMTPESFKAAGYHGGAYVEKKPLLAKALEVYRASGDAALLGAFMAGYMAYKREEKSSLDLKEGYLEIVITPLRDLLEKSADPHKVMSDATASMPARDRETLCNLLLRSLCSNTNDTALVRVVIAAGADVHTLNERPLINAVDKEHLAVATALIRNHGARLGDAVLEVQTNFANNQKLKDRLYALMATEYNTLTRQPAALSTPVLSKKAVAAKGPTP